MIGHLNFIKAPLTYVYKFYQKHLKRQKASSYLRFQSTPVPTWLKSHNYDVLG